MVPCDNQLDSVVIKRIVAVNIVLIGWMTHENITETTPEQCYERLAEAHIYPQREGSNRFRNDLRYLRDHNLLDIFFDIRVYQARNRLWHIEVNSSSMAL